MSTNHFIVKCICGIVISTCRCPSNDKVVRWVTNCTHNRKAPMPDGWLDAPLTPGGQGGDQ